MQDKPSDNCFSRQTGRKIDFEMLVWDDCLYRRTGRNMNLKMAVSGELLEQKDRTEDEP